MESVPVGLGLLAHPPTRPPNNSAKKRGLGRPGRGRATLLGREGGGWEGCIERGRLSKAEPTPPLDRSTAASNPLRNETRKFVRRGLDFQRREINFFFFFFTVKFSRDAISRWRKIFILVEKYIKRIFLV